MVLLRSVYLWFFLLGFGRNVTREMQAVDAKISVLLNYYSQFDIYKYTEEQMGNLFPKNCSDFEWKGMFCVFFCLVLG